MPAPLRVLTVGDGDLSYSLALQRAFGNAIQLTATVLPTEDELAATYTMAAANAAELRSRGATVLYGIDATALAPSLGPLEAVVFNHPHLGLADLQTQAAHARRHNVLVAHFLKSARTLLVPGGRVHLTLCGTQPKVWRAEEHARRLGLGLASSTPTATPFFAGLGAPAVPAETAWAARRRFRVAAHEGGLGGRHWLGAYGYEHRRTQNDADMRVDNSVELVFQASQACATAAAAPTGEAAAAATGDADGGDGATCGGWRCAVCGLEFESEAARESHVRDLASPDVWLTAAPPPPPQATSENGGGPDVGAADAAAAGAQHRCEVCGEGFGVAAS